MSKLTIDLPQWVIEARKQISGATDESVSQVLCQLLQDVTRQQLIEKIKKEETDAALERAKKRVAQIGIVAQQPAPGRQNGGATGLTGASECK